MPTIDRAMADSLETRGFMDLLVGSLHPLARRDFDPNSFSSWDNCMEASYCKWPAIALMILGGLILFSIIWCIGRCLCCGYACCCTCFKCLSCCGMCDCCCERRGEKRHKYLDEPYIPPHQGYRPEPPMKAEEPPQYAVFEVRPKGGDDDTLPSMPSAQGEEIKKDSYMDEGVELNQLQKPAPAQTAPLMAASSMSPAPTPSPMGRSPYGSQQNHLAGSGYFAGVNGAYGGQQGFQQDQSPYSQSGVSMNSVPSKYGMPMSGGATMGAVRTNSPRLVQGGWDQGRASPMAPVRHATYDGPHNHYHNMSPARSATYDYGAPSQPPGGHSGYGQQPDPAFDSYRRSPRPLMGGAGGYGQPDLACSTPPSQQQQAALPDDYDGSYNGGLAGNNRYGSPAPPQFNRQYSSDSSQPLNNKPAPLRNFSDVDVEPALSSPGSLRNNSGFDFNSGFSRPGTADGSTTGPIRPSGGHGTSGLHESTGPSIGAGATIPASTSPAPANLTRAGGGGAYPGYRAYQPAF